MKIECLQTKEIDHFGYDGALNLHNGKTWLSGCEKYDRNFMMGKTSIVYKDDWSIGTHLFLEDGYGYTMDMVFKITGKYINALEEIWFSIEVLYVL